MYNKCMAKRIRSEDVPLDPRVTYPWREWTDGEWWRVTRGEDYTSETATFRSNVYAYARRNNWKVTTKCPDDGTDGLVFAFRAKESS